MKKVLLVATIAFAFTSLTSCKKDYTCECTTAYPSGSQTASFTVNAKKKDADAACTALQTTVTSGTTTITQSCKIK